MAISSALARLRRNGLADLPSDQFFEQLCVAHGQRWRERLLPPLLMLKLFLLQIVHGNTAINHLRQLSGLAFAAGSYCEARARLSLAVLGGLLQTMLQPTADVCDRQSHHEPRQFAVLLRPEDQMPVVSHHAESQNADRHE